MNTDTGTNVLGTGQGQIMFASSQSGSSTYPSPHSELDYLLQDFDDPERRHSYHNKYPDRRRRRSRHHHPTYHETPYHIAYRKSSNAIVGCGLFTIHTGEAIWYGWYKGLAGAIGIVMGIYFFNVLNHAIQLHDGIFGEAHSNIDPNITPESTLKELWAGLFISAMVTIFHIIITIVHSKCLKPTSKHLDDMIEHNYVLVPKSHVTVENIDPEVLHEMGLSSSQDTQKDV
ncbi:MAG: hypothetical protein ACTSUE_18090 [Promethearchaeota archaeon]